MSAARCTRLEAELTLDEVYERVELPSVNEPEPVGYEVDWSADDSSLA